MCTPRYAALAVLILSACTEAHDPAPDSPSEEAREVSEGAGASHASSALAAVVVDFPPTGSYEELVAHLAAAFAACAVVDTDETTYATVRFEGCSGANGQVELTGVLSLALLEVGSKTTYDMNADLLVGQAVLKGDWSLTVDESSASWDGSFYSDGPDGRRITTSSSGTVEVRDGCLAIDAEMSWQGRRGLTWTAEARDLVLCDGQCSWSGQVELRGPRGRIALEFDGGLSVGITGPDGGTVGLAPICNPEQD